MQQQQQKQGPLLLLERLTMLVPDILPTAQTSAPAFEFTEDRMLPPCGTQHRLCTDECCDQLSGPVSSMQGSWRLLLYSQSYRVGCMLAGQLGMGVDAVTL
jgi:hypothetical protein